MINCPLEAKEYIKALEILTDTHIGIISTSPDRKDTHYRQEMKTRFSDILKVKKQKLSDIERELLDVRNRKKIVEIEIEKVDLELSTLQVPQSGNFTLMQIARRSFLYLVEQKEILNQQLALRTKQIEGLKELYKEANIEYEKNSLSAP